MPEQPLWPDVEAADGGRSGVAVLARAALQSPAAPPEAERAARERALARFRESPPSARSLRPEVGPPSPRRKSLLGRLLRRLRRR